MVWSSVARLGVLAVFVLGFTWQASAQFPKIPKPSLPKPSLPKPPQLPKLPNPIDAAKDAAARLDRERLEAQRRAEQAARKKAAELDAARKRVEAEVRKVREQYESLKRQAQEAEKNYETARRFLNSNPSKSRDEIVRHLKQAAGLRSNKDSVQASIRGRDRLSQVIYGKEFDHLEQKQFATAMAASVVSANPGPVLVYLKTFLAQTKVEVVNNLKQASREVRDKLSREFDMLVIQALDKAVRQGKALDVSLHGVDVEIGLATYNHWVELKWKEPSLDRVDSGVPGVPGYRLRQKDVERKLPLPNTFQPYLKVRVRFSTR